MSTPAIDPLNRRLLRNLISISAGVLFITIIFGWFFYADTYRVFHDYISYLGGANTAFNLYPNPVSQYIFTGGMILCAGLTLVMAIVYLLPKNWTALNLIKALFLLIMTAGSFIIGYFQWDSATYGSLHDVGAASYYLAFDVYVVLCQFARYKRRKIEFKTENTKNQIADKIVVILMLFITVLYFVLFGGKLIFPGWADTLRTGMVVVQKLIVLFFMIGVIMLDLDDF